MSKSLFGIKGLLWTFFALYVCVIPSDFCYFIRSPVSLIWSNSFTNHKLCTGVCVYRLLSMTIQFCLPGSEWYWGWTRFLGSLFCSRSHVKIPCIFIEVLQIRVSIRLLYAFVQNNMDMYTEIYNKLTLSKYLTRFSSTIRIPSKLI